MKRMSLVLGPVWAEPGQTGLSVLYPLRVENAMFNLVDRFLPGIISTTPHARYLGLHPMVRSEAIARGLDAIEGQDLMRRAEAVLAAISFHHRGAHLVSIPEGHGESMVATLLESDGGIDVAKVAAKGAYSDAAAGFYGTYRGPELVLGVIGAGADQEPGDRYNAAAVRPGLADVLDLAGRSHLSADDLKAASYLCPCAAADDEAAWLRQIVCGTAGGDEYAVADEARRDTARIVTRIVQNAGTIPLADLQTTLREAIAFGPPLESGLLVGIDLAEGWRGAILRNYSIEAWRNTWWWIVRELTEPQTAAEIGSLYAAQLPEDWTVGDLDKHLPATADGAHLLPVEADLRNQHPRPHPLTELLILAAGARRTTETTGRTRKILEGATDDDLNPRWVANELTRNASRPLRAWAVELVESLLWRSHRVALTKLDLRDPQKPRLPAQVIERDGRWSKQAPAGNGPVGLRLPSFTSMLAGCGVLASSAGGWSLTPEGAAFVA
jgi:hypothetical protein